ncbi:MAG: hypothetical protein GVY12_12970 [Bacteroidetes bacterium]|jgi:flagellar protein FliO/FliZ|nr:hypothetical protein [Bacteroidota bacterium]
MPSLSSLAASSPDRRRDVLRRVLYLVAGLFFLWCAVYLFPTDAPGPSEEPAAVVDENASPDAGFIARTAEGPALWTPGNAIALLLLLGGGAWALYLQRRQAEDAEGGTTLEALETLRLAANQEVRLVRCGSDVLVLGVTSGQITCLSTYPAEALSAAAHADTPAAEAPTPSPETEPKAASAAPLAGDGATAAATPNFATLLERMAGQHVRNTPSTGTRSSR